MDRPSRNELLIRSASSLLSIICPPTYPPDSQNLRLARLLDRTALLFVTEPEADASAVAVILSGNETIMMRVTEGSTHMNADEVSRKPCHEWLFECCRKYGPMGPAQHAAHLEYLFHQLQDPTDKDCIASFGCFVYFQCFPNISHRINHPFSGLFHFDSIDPAFFRARFVSTSGAMIPDPKIAKHGDGWIMDLWTMSLEKPPVFELRNGIEHLVYNAESAIDLHHLICHVFNLLTDEMDIVALARRVHKTPEIATNEYMWSLKRALYGMEYYLDFFASLIRSPCWEKHIRQPTVIQWVVAFGDCPEAKSLDPIAALNKWLQSIGEWSCAINQNVYPSKSNKAMFSRAVKIQNLQVPRAPEPHHQSTLTALLIHVSDRSAFEADDAARILQALAATKPYSDQNWRRLTKHYWNGWAQGFTGSTHCAAELISTLEDPDDPFGTRAKRVIGVDTPCCTICSLYIYGLNPNVAFGTPSGKICPWATPQHESEEVEIYILGILTKMVEKRLVELGTMVIEPHREAGARATRDNWVKIRGRYRLVNDGGEC